MKKSRSKTRCRDGKLSPLDLDPQPEGKRIEEVWIDASQVILPGDFPPSNYIPWTWLNAVRADAARSHRARAAVSGR